MERDVPSRRQKENRILRYVLQPFSENSPLQDTASCTSKRHQFISECDSRRRMGKPYHLDYHDDESRQWMVEYHVGFTNHKDLLIISKIEVILEYVRSEVARLESEKPGNLDQWRNLDSIRAMAGEVLDKMGEKTDATHGSTASSSWDNVSQTFDLIVAKRPDLLRQHLRNCDDPFWIVLAYLYDRLYCSVDQKSTGLSHQLAAMAVNQKVTPYIEPYLAQCQAKGLKEVCDHLQLLKKEVPNDFLLEQSDEDLITNAKNWFASNYSFHQHVLRPLEAPGVVHTLEESTDSVTQSADSVTQSIDSVTQSADC